MAEVFGDLLVKGKILDLKPETLANDPAAGDLVAPRLWVNTTSNTLRFYNGTTTVSLGAAGAGSVTPEELTAALADYTTTTALTALLADYTTDAELTAALANYTDTAALTQLLLGYVKTADLETAVELAVEKSFFPIDSASAATHTITHNLGYRWPNVQVVDAATNKVITPDSIEFTTVNELVITVAPATALKGSVVWVKAT